MVTEKTPTSIFLFAHQDDEFGVYRQILVEQRLGRQIICAYLTSGVPLNGNPSVRNNESLAVLAKLGVPPKNVVFAGLILGIPDGKMVDSLETASAWMKPWIESFDVAAVYTPAWEGGHPDHDALHAISVQICSELSLHDAASQYPLYNARGLPKPLFRVLTALTENGPIEKTIIPWAERLRFLGYALSYPSQRGSWIGLFPFMLLHYLFSGTQQLQRVSRDRITLPPHEGTLYYEHRAFSTWQTLKCHIDSWLSARAAAVLPKVGMRHDGLDSLATIQNHSVSERDSAV